MATLRSYLKAEDAFLDAAYLGSMGINASVVDARGSGGMLMGVADPHITIEVPDEQCEDALLWLAKQEKTVAVPPAPVFDPAWDVSSLHRFFKVLLIFDLACFAVGIAGEHISFLQTAAPAEVTTYARSLVLSVDLWNLFYITFWPMYGLSILSSVLCLFYSRTGRLLFAATTVWGLLAILGPPPELGAPIPNFMGVLQATATNIALALMYWSPVRQKFDQHRMPKG